MNNKIIAAISLRRKFKVPLFTEKSIVNPPGESCVGAVVANVKQFGFVLSPQLVTGLLKSDYDFVVEFHNWLIAELKKMVGANKRHKPMYPNFPEQVAKASDAELYFNAIMHYFGDVIGERIMPDYEDAPRPAFLEGFGDCNFSKLKVIGLATDEESSGVLDDILASKATPSQQDKEDIVALLAEGCVATVDEIPCKETLAFAFSVEPWIFVKYVKTATDVLRIAACMSNGDISLAKQTKFKSFKRQDRRMLLTLLDRIPYDMAAEDMMRYRAEWKRLSERLHPGEYATKYPTAYMAINLIRNKGVLTFNSKLEQMLNQGPSYDLLELIKTRPGDFARRLDKMVRMSKEPLPVVRAFTSVIGEVSTPLLHQLYSHFWTKEKLVEMKEKICFPKGDVAKAMSFTNNVEVTDVDDDVAYSCRNELMRRYALLPKLGKVWVDPVVGRLLIPQANRSASTALYQVGRGSRFKVGSEKDTVRLFMYWHDQKGDNGSGDRNYDYGSRVDLDLSAMFLGENFEDKGHCSWTQLRNGTNSYHSGDITSAPDGASEFLDVNLSKLDKDIRYIACTVTCYTGQPMKDLQEAFCGVMLREKPNSGEIYEPTSVATRADLRSDSTQTMPFLFDVVTRELIWADLTINTYGWGHSVENSRSKQALACDAVARMIDIKPSMADLFTWHVIARTGEFVQTREEAEVVIAADGDVNPFDVATIMSTWV